MLVVVSKSTGVRFSSNSRFCCEDLVSFISEKACSQMLSVSEQACTNSWLLPQIRVFVCGNSRKIDQRHVKQIAPLSSDVF